MSGSRPGLLVVVTGTATDIGKTWLSARVAQAARSRGLSVAARKPAQSFAPGDDLTGRTDAQVLAAATAAPDPYTVCPAARWYAAPMAPPMAAAVLGRPIPTIGDLATELTWPDPPPALGLVETAGGPRSPLAADGDTIELLRTVRADRVVLVADAGLGTINAVRLCVAALAPASVLVFLNRFTSADDLHRRNRAWLDAELAEPCAVEVEALLDRLIGPARPSSAEKWS